MYTYLYTIQIMKKKELERRLTKYGWWLERHGGNHDIWTNSEFRVPIPRHREINERTAKSIIKEVEKYRI